MVGESVSSESRQRESGERRDTRRVQGGNMSSQITLLEPAALFAHARDAARNDEARHSLETSGPRSSQQNEQTVRGWGGAALNDLEWVSHGIYPKEQRDEYRRVYAVEYLRQRHARTRA